MNPVPTHAQAFAAPAKLNLDLRITGRRSDGYHNLESIFCLISLYDTVYLAVRDDDKIILHTPTQGVLPEQDLSFRAATALQSYTGGAKGADIWLEKRIPMGGGLGGGSSDAATVLLALNHLWQCGLSRETLMTIGLKLGADVPFFIFGKNAFAQGVGEQLREIAIPKQWYVVVRPPVHVATSVIFSHEGLTRDSKSSIMPTFQTVQPFRNDMQAVVLEAYPEVLQVYEKLKQYGSPLMTGSGACLFISFQMQKDAQAVYSRISNEYKAYCVEGLARHPLLDI
ncbi:4-(cytidine 5'-diphospho)-2-C-methyl-D-erythritol kinase [Uruburuella testudinis]|uniref:4-diphosphocytidyl-2-C-methyl-D-erythritol kinase n=1 Tax=Uruburuella testudinis TaxID=1282863 RepID=A0ABY4DRB4_9NEIS|nr:4-(cytidine 5'-diphospho)-2-C-methyl-D-erythritol kinase [Uruburuella testudinis]UOO81431.1 4-(cytidine 5'-diphospho)-2-C-methyl-D-erythritol kinase [Uruburuella testudinis]